MTQTESCGCQRHIIFISNMWSSMQYVNDLLWHTHNPHLETSQEKNQNKTKQSCLLPQFPGTLRPPPCWSSRETSGEVNLLLWSLTGSAWDLSPLPVSSSMYQKGVSFKQEFHTLLTMCLLSAAASSATTHSSSFLPNLGVLCFSLADFFLFFLIL